jgi:hypothetical protein
LIEIFPVITQENDRLEGGIKLSTESVDNLGYKVSPSLLHQVFIGSGYFCANVANTNQTTINQ